MMQSKFTLGIRQKVLLVLMTVLLFALSLSGWFSLNKERENIEQETMRRGNDIARFVAKSMTYSIIGYDYETIKLLLSEITKSEEISFAQVLNKNDKQMGISGSLAILNNDDILTFSKPITFDDKKVGRLIIGLSTKKSNERLAKNTASLIAREALIIFLIAIGEFVALSYIIIRPVKLITLSLDKGVSDDGKNIVNIPINSGDEFGQLANKFNELGKELGEANEKLQYKIDAADDRLNYTIAVILRTY